MRIIYASLGTLRKTRRNPSCSVKNLRSAQRLGRFRRIEPWVI